MPPNDEKRNAEDVASAAIHPRKAANDKDNKSDKEEDTKVQKQEVPSHHMPCSREFHTEEEVNNSLKDYPWAVVEPYDGKDWVSWSVLGLKASHPKYDIKWRNCAPMSLAWTGLVILGPGQVEPLHNHTTPMIYYILQGTPIISLNYIKNRTSKWQCINIPSYCPHGIVNDSKDVEVVIAWCYLPLDDAAKPGPDRNYNWKFLEELDTLNSEESNNGDKTNTA